MSTARAELEVVLDELHVLHGLAGDRLWIADPGRPFTVHEIPAPGTGRLRELVSGATEVGVLVADRLASAQRRVLDEAGWAWWDRRGRLSLVGRGGRTEFDVAPVPTPAATRPDPLARTVGRTIGLALLRAPDQRWSVRDAATAAGASVGGAGRTMAELGELGLVDRGRVTSTRRLFARLAATWRPAWHGLAADAGPVGRARDEVLGFGLAQSDPAGWALVDRHAVVALGGAASTQHAPLRLLVPDAGALAWAVRTHGVEGDGELEVALAPTPLAVTARRPWGGDRAVPWRLADPLVVALTLAGSDEDPDRDVLGDWLPPPTVVADPPWRAHDCT